MTESKKYVLLIGVQYHNRFFTTNTPGNDPTKGENGETWYRILGYADTIAEAQSKLYQMAFPHDAGEE